jgi:hypothetical protein
MVPVTLLFLAMSAVAIVVSLGIAWVLTPSPGR